MHFLLALTSFFALGFGCALAVVDNGSLLASLEGIRAVEGEHREKAKQLGQVNNGSSVEEAAKRVKGEDGGRGVEQRVDRQREQQFRRLSEQKARQFNEMVRTKSTFKLARIASTKVGPPDPAEALREAVQRRRSAEAIESLERAQRERSEKMREVNTDRELEEQANKKTEDFGQKVEKYRKLSAQRSRKFMESVRQQTETLNALRSVQSEADLQKSDASAPSAELDSAHKDSLERVEHLLRVRGKAMAEKRNLEGVAPTVQLRSAQTNVKNEPKKDDPKRDGPKHGIERTFGVNLRTASKESGSRQQRTSGQTNQGPTTTQNKAPSFDEIEAEPTEGQEGTEAEEAGNEQTVQKRKRSAATLCDRLREKGCAIL